MRNKSYLLAVFLLLSSQFSKAQEIFPDDTQDINNVPIDNSILILGIVGVFIILYFIKGNNLKHRHKKSTF